MPPELPRISDYLFHYAQRTPDKVFLISSGQQVTYAEAALQVAALSRSLLSSGVGVGDRVATMASPSTEFVLTFLATVDIGGIWLGLNPKYTFGELQHVMVDCSPSVVFGPVDHDGPTGPDDLATGFGAITQPKIITFGGELAESTSFTEFLRAGELLSDDARVQARNHAGGERPALIVYTSGTTGVPKGAVLSHTSLCWSFARQGHRWGGAAMRVICNLPINHSGCVGDIFSSALTAGGTVVLMERFDPDRMLEVIESERVNTLMQIPTMYQILAARPSFKTADLSSLRTVVWGGAAMPGPVLKAFARPGVATAVVYGQSEAPASITFSEPDASWDQLTSTLGRPDPDMEVRLARVDGAECSLGEPGEIQIRHSSTFLEYFGNPEATRAAFTGDGFLHTGDVAVEMPDGYFKMVGRMKEMFKSGGSNVYPREIELALEKHPDVTMAVVVSLADELYGEIGHAFVVLREGAAVAVDDLVSWCRERLANYKVPKGITQETELPMLPIGKPDRRALQQTAIEFHEAAKAFRMENA